MSEAIAIGMARAAWNDRPQRGLFDDQPQSVQDNAVIDVQVGLKWLSENIPDHVANAILSQMNYSKHLVGVDGMKYAKLAFMAGLLTASRAEVDLDKILDAIKKAAER